MAETLFDLVIREEIPTWKVWEDKSYVAFLTPFPNTPGVTVVIPKVNHGDYVFDLENELYLGLMQATQKVAKALEKALGVSRVALVFEGTGVAHVHAKLYPLHGELGGATDIWSKHEEFYPNYVGYLTTVEGPKMSDADLNELQAKISAELQ